MVGHRARIGGKYQAWVYHQRQVFAVAFGKTKREHFALQYKLRGYNYSFALYHLVAVRRFFDNVAQQGTHYQITPFQTQAAGVAIAQAYLFGVGLWGKFKLIFYLIALLKNTQLRMRVNVLVAYSLISRHIGRLLMPQVVVEALTVLLAALHFGLQVTAYKLYFYAMRPNPLFGQGHALCACGCGGMVRTDFVGFVEGILKSARFEKEEAGGNLCTVGNLRIPLASVLYKFQVVLCCVFRQAGLLCIGL